MNIIMSTPKRLNAVWKTASSVAAVSSSQSHAEIHSRNRSMNGRMKMAIIPVIVLKRMWAVAVRLALAVPPMAAKSAVIVVPIFAPITALAASVIGSPAVMASVMMTAIEALDDCMRTVRRNPANRNMITERMPFPEYAMKST